MPAETRRHPPIRGWCLTEDPALYDRVLRQGGETVEFISYQEAARRLALTTARSARPAAGTLCGEPERESGRRVQHERVL